MMDIKQFDEFTFMLMRDQKNMHKVFSDFLENAGLNYTAAMCVRIIGAQHDGASASDICSCSGFDKGLVSRTLKQLGTKGLICRNPADCRTAKGFRLLLTPLGEKLALQMDLEIFEILKKLSNNISDEDLLTYCKVSSKFADNLAKAAKSVH